MYPTKGPRPLPTGPMRHALLLSVVGCATAHATGNVVTTCEDDGSPGALRQVIEAAGGTKVDLTQLPGCSDVSITVGTLQPSHPPLLVGPSDKTVTISANFAGSGPVLQVSSVGSLALSHLTMNCNGHPGLDTGHSVDVALDHATITGCDGGAVVALLSLSMTASSVSNNPASGPCTLCGHGAIYTGQFTCVDSTISGNALGGVSLEQHYDASVNRCTIDSNDGYGLQSRGGGAAILILDSTISGNAGTGVFFASPYSYIRQSTVAYNNIGVETANAMYAHGSIFARNTLDDLSLTTAFGDIYGSNNLATTWHSDNALTGQPFASTSDPHIMPLAWHTVV